MAETEAQMMVELNKHLGEFRVNSARRFEEQKLHSQNMEKQMLEMKEILISMAARYRVQAEDTTVVKECSQGCTPVPISAKEPSHQVAHQVLDEMSEPKESSDSTAHQVLEEMPSKEIELMDGLARDDVDLNQQTLDLEVPVIRQRILDEKLDASRLSKVIDISTNGNLLINLSSGAEKITAELVTAEHELPVAAAQDDLKVFRGGMTMIHMGLMCFDPGGLVVLNAFRYLNSSAEFSFSRYFETVKFDPGGSVDEVSASLEAYNCDIHACLGWSVVRKSVSSNQLNKAAIEVVWNACCRRILYGDGHLVFMTNDGHMEKEYYAEIFEFDHEGEALVSLCELLNFDIAKDRNFSDCGLFIENVACLDTFCFDTGGECSMPTDEVLHEIKHLMVFVLVLQLCYFHDSALKFLILEDKDRLKEGVLLQENGC